ncbi:MAG: LamG-like jellyroll fold domain-containing protein [Candidatus Paceibacterota bacterium]|jgi:prepilin-type N-terminal cleavage/methylation domain-containing protein
MLISKTVLVTWWGNVKIYGMEHKKGPMKKALSFGFSLIELLVVVALIGILARVIFSNVSTTREKSRISAGTAFDANTQYSFSSKLVGEWTFDEDSRSVQSALDWSGNGNNATVFNGSITWGTSTGYNKKGAYYFGSANTNYISIPDSSTLDLTLNITITAWVYITANSWNSGVVFKEANGAHFPSASQGAYSFGFYTGGNQKLMVRLNSSTTEGSGQLTSPKILSLGKWYNIAFTFNKQKITIYIDGVKDSSSSYTPSINATDGNLKIGNYYNGSYGFFGYIDDVRIYNVALTAEDMQRLYAEGKLAHMGLAVTK